MTAIITDRASIAKQIALALNIELKTGSEGYFQGRGYTVVWMPDELVSLAQPEDCGKKRLAKNDLPFIPKPFVLSLRKQKTGKKPAALTDKTALKQLEIIRKIFNDCQSIIAATEPNEQGELNFRRMYAYLQCTKPFRRLALHSLTLKAIGEGFKNLRESALYDNLYAAADCREKADYLIKINASNAFSLSTGMANRSLGRIEMPVLAMVCKRFAEHRKFISKRFYEHGITLEKDGQLRRFKVPGKIEKKKKAEKIYQQLKNFREVHIIKTAVQSAVQPAPMLYNLTELQKEASVRYGFSASKTMETARKLYEEKLISYPLTDSRRIPESVFSGIYKIIRQTAAYCELADRLEVIDQSNLNRRSVGDVHISEPHALIPTGVYPPCLSKDGKLIYRLIAGRTLEAFAPDCVKEITSVEAACGNRKLESQLSEILCLGWRAILNREEDREENELKADDILPAFTEGETVRISGWNLLTKKTLPKALYTEASLSAEMENSCLGTPQTRAEIIETLLSCNYMERRKQSLIPTEKGQVVYNCIKDMRIADMELAASWEKMSAEIREGKQDADTFMRAFEIFVKQATEEILNMQKISP